MGATVIKTEPLHGDAQRTQGPGFGCEKNDYEDPTFDLNNTNKDLVAINLKDEDGMKFMKKLLADADVFVVNLRDKALKKLGLDWETPRRILLVMTQYAGLLVVALPTFSVRRISLLLSLLRHSATTTLHACWLAVSAPLCSTAPVPAWATRL